MYYRLNVDISNTEIPSKLLIKESIKIYNKSWNGKALIFLSGYSDKKIKLLGHVFRPITISDWVEEVLQFMPVSPSSFNFRELTMFEAEMTEKFFNQVLKTYLDHLGFDIYKYKLDHLILEPYRETYFKDENQSCKILPHSLKKEIKRIKTVRPHTINFLGHPTHYLITRGDSESETALPILNPLLRNLYAHHRLPSQKVGTVVLKINYNSYRERDDDSFLQKNNIKLQVNTIIPLLVHLNYYGTLHIDLRKIDLPKVEVDLEQILVSELVKYMRRYRHKVLFVFTVSKENHHLINLLKSQILLPLVELSDNLTPNQALRYLEDKATADGLKLNKQLTDGLSNQVEIPILELNQMWDTWRDNLVQENFHYVDYSIKSIRLPKGSAYQRLDQMVGLENVKKTIHLLVDSIKIQKLRHSRGLMSDEQLSKHMFFSGSPGTAKTTVARLYAQVLKDNGVLSKGYLVEVGRADLIGKYTGWTAKIVREKFQQAKGSVLFIDEAYALLEQDGSYGDEAINTIVQEMEVHREDVVVIFAGYPDKMADFIERNPGLKSRIAFHLYFDDYTDSDLFAIFELMLQQKGMILDTQAIEGVKKLLSKAKEVENFGNGRYVRTLIEKASMQQASRLLNKATNHITDEELVTLNLEDLDNTLLTEATNKKSTEIGFRN